MNWHDFFQRLFYGDGTPLEKIMDLPTKHPIECLALMLFAVSILVLLT
jgi:hypothetical protein